MSPDPARATGLAAPTVRRVCSLYEGWGRYLKAEIELADGSVVTREMEDHGDAACVLPFDPDRKVAMLVRQLRAPLLFVAGLQDLLEAPAGRLDGDDPAACAIREAEEEAGLTLRDLIPIGASAPMPGVSTERIHLFLASYSERDRTGRGGGVATETESMVVTEIPLAGVAALADDGRLPDMKTHLLIQTLRLRRPDLF